MTRTPTLTAAVIALDEAANLPGWLASLAWADERLVVDGGSTDGTIEAARAGGARLIQRPFDNFCRQRNHALDVAAGDWVLFVDADERPTAALAAELRCLVRDTRHAAFRIPIRSRILGRRFRFSGTQDDRPVRLVRRGRGHWVGDVHEVLRPAGLVGRTRGWLRHETIPDLPALLGKINRYTSLQAVERVKAGRRPHWTDTWIAPAREIFRRLIWKHGWLDGPEGWVFCLLSGLSEWMVADKHRGMVRDQRRRVERSLQAERIEALLHGFPELSPSAGCGSRPAGLRPRIRAVRLGGSRALSAPLAVRATHE